jgi:subtilisin family serine protease
VENQYLVKVPSQSKDAIDISNALFATGLFELAEPNFVRILKRQTADPLYADQWGLKNTGQYSGVVGADIKAEYAWSVTMGSSSIKVAVIDEGVSLNHPDLVATLLSGFDATGNGSGGGPSGNDAHGTGCAGIIAANSNNNLGGSGIAPNCKILPVRIAYNSGGSWVTDDAKIANGINWAWQNGADVLSNSWGGGSPSSTITNAITAATTSGRGGKGSVVVFAAGNSNSAIIYPAYLSNVMAIGAMSMCNERKTPTSCDGENWWGSCFGPELDVVAPGVKIPTCDLPGAAGYGSGDYVTNFNGTSSATPHVSAICALVLSVNPNLTYSQVYDNIRCTANKVGSYVYTSGFNNEMGYGRVNVFNALMGACAPSYQLSNQIFSGQSITYQASTRIKLEPGFRAYSGSFTHVKLGCTSCPNYSPLLRVEDEEVASTPTSIENTPENMLSPGNSYPNPITSGYLNFGSVAEVYTLRNSTGEVIRQGANTEKLDINGLSKGMYILRKDDKSEKIIVE